MTRLFGTITKLALLTFVVTRLLRRDEPVPAPVRRRR